MRRALLTLLNRLVRCLRLIAFGTAGVAGLVLVFAVLAVPFGAAYAWGVTGVSPVAQLREGGMVVVLLFWPILGIAFGALHIAGAFLEEPGGAWGVAGVTGCLAALWLVAIRRGRAYRHTVLGQRLRKSTGGRTSG